MLIGIAAIARSRVPAARLTAGRQIGHWKDAPGGVACKDHGRGRFRARAQGRLVVRHRRRARRASRRAPPRRGPQPRDCPRRRPGRRAVVAPSAHASHVSVLRPHGARRAGAARARARGELGRAGRGATELLGPGDVVWVQPPADALLPAEPVWSVPEAARVAILDDRLLQILRTWPGVGRLLLERAACREARLFTHRAIAQLPRVDQRLLAFFAHLSERWGRVGAEGVVMPLHLTHETLGRLIGARRPTVSLALKDLAADRLLERRNDGSWLLRYEAFDRLGATAAVPTGWQPADA